MYVDAPTVNSFYELNSDENMCRASAMNYKKKCLYFFREQMKDVQEEPQEWNQQTEDTENKDPK